MPQIRNNERTWAGHVISWIKEAIDKGQTVFEEATNDAGLKVVGNRTKFPDVLLYSDRVSGTIFNGWELKLPDTAVDDQVMLENALEKAKALSATSFVTWNGSEATIWGIENEHYNLDSLSEIKVYPPIPGISTRADIEEHTAYNRNVPRLKSRLLEILHDLEQLKEDGRIKEAVNIATTIVDTITHISRELIPHLTAAIQQRVNSNADFQRAFGRWKILEKATIKILSKSSRRQTSVNEFQVLAKFTYYRLIGKVLFYLTLSDKLAGRIEPLVLEDGRPAKVQLEEYFDAARTIDYQAVFEIDFTDTLPFSGRIDSYIRHLVVLLNEYDFSILPSEVIGTILENLVPREEKQQFGQYFTPEKLTYLVTLSALRSVDDVVVDPTSGTGSFLNTFYKVLKSLGQESHQSLLNQIWGNDISHLPAILSVINIYKQDVTDTANFPRVTRKDFFRLEPAMLIPYPDPYKEGEFVDVPLPTFDAIISNFPFIQYEDVPEKERLVEAFEQEFGRSQSAFLDGRQFFINGKANYFAYCFYHSLKFLRDGGFLAAITSNAWLGKNYGLQFKQFLLDNFSLRYVVKSNAEHWFQDSQVSTIFTTVQKVIDDAPTRFVTLNFKLDDYLEDDASDTFISEITDLYNEIDNCDLEGNDEWEQDAFYPNVYHKVDGTVKVSIVSRVHLLAQLETEENWSINFLAEDPLSVFADALINPFPHVYTVGRGTKANTDEYQVLSAETVEQSGIEEEFLVPAIKSNREIARIHHTDATTNYLFICEEPEAVLQSDYPNAHSWVQRFSRGRNKIGIPYPVALQKKRPFWYSLRPEQPANIYISLNPNKRIFFAYSDHRVYLNQRLVAIRVANGDVELIAALLNSIVSLLYVELNGVSRSLGALDLNADFFRTRMRMLNPALLDNEARTHIIEAFQPVANREVEDYDVECRREDRRHFDAVVLDAFGYDAALIPQLYEILTTTITDRIEMKDR